MTIFSTGQIRIVAGSRQIGAATVEIQITMDTQHFYTDQPKFVAAAGL